MTFITKYSKNLNTVPEFTDLTLSETGAPSLLALQPPLFQTGF
jgi:hypothetical protein